MSSRRRAGEGRDETAGRPFPILADFDGAAAGPPLVVAVSHSLPAIPEEEGEFQARTMEENNDSSELDPDYAYVLGKVDDMLRAMPEYDQEIEVPFSMAELMRAKGELPPMPPTLVSARKLTATLWNRISNQTPANGPQYPKEFLDWMKKDALQQIFRGARAHYKNDLPGRA